MHVTDPRYELYINNNLVIITAFIMTRSTYIHFILSSLRQWNTRKEGAYLSKTHTCFRVRFRCRSHLQRESFGCSRSERSQGLHQNGTISKECKPKSALVSPGLSLKVKLTSSLRLGCVRSGMLRVIVARSSPRGEISVSELVILRNSLT